MALRKASSKKNIVISGPLETSEPSPPVEGRVIGQRMNALAVSNSQTSRKSVHEGILMKRCRLSWRERIVEVIRDAADYSGIKTSYWLLIFDPQKRTLKDRISMEDIVTIRASCDCYFQIFLSNGKILQFRTDSMESQAYWMALIKVGLGRGSIFHVQVHTAQKGLEHALLYSIGVNLPAHRVGQLDRILVLASPVNDINIHAWDLNRVKHFMRLDIGVQMELCSSCMTSSVQGTSITFILDKLYHQECVEFLCHEARISNEPVREKSLLLYPVNHNCAQRPSHPDSNPPSYLNSQKQKMEMEETGSYYSDIPPRLPPRNNLYNTRRAGNVQEDQSAAAGDSVPPRNITRKNFETAIPAVAHPYTNFQPHLFQQFSSSYESPYQISSRIIITNSGEVQYERNILGNKHQNNGGFHFKRDMPLPPRKSQTTAATHVKSFPSNSHAPKHFATRTQSCRPATQDHSIGRRLEKRASELSDSGDSYVFIPDIIRDPNRVPPPSADFGDLQPQPSPATLPRDDLGGPALPRPPMGDSSLQRPPVDFTQSRLREVTTSLRSSLDDYDDVIVDSTQSHLGEDMTSLQSVNDYDDVIVISQQVCSNGAIPQVLASQEIRSNSPILVLPLLDDADQPTRVRSTSPQKPAIKPRRKKPSSESDVYPTCDPNSSQGITSAQKSLTIPKSCSPSLCSELDTASHHRLNLLSPDSTASSSPSLDILQRSASDELPMTDPTVQTRRVLIHPPLTPPIPRPRGTCVRFAEHTLHAEDDSLVGRQSGVENSLKQRSLSTPFLPQDMPVSDV